MIHLTPRRLKDYVINECGLERICKVTDLVDFVIDNWKTIRMETQAQEETLKRLKEMKRKWIRVPYRELEREIVETILSLYTAMTGPVIKGVNKLMSMLGNNIYILRQLRARQHIENLEDRSSRLNEMKRQHYILNLETGYDTNGVTPFPPCDLAGCYDSSENQDHEEQFYNRGIISVPSYSYHETKEEQLRDTGLENYNDNKFSTEAINYESCVGVEIPNRDLNY